MNLRWRIAQHFEQYWWRRYLHGKHWAEYYQWKCGYWNNLLQQAATLTPELAILLDTPQRVLDAGCGPAGIYMVLHNHQVTAIDPLLHQYRYWLDDFKPEQYPWTHFRNLPLERFKAREPYPLVFCMNALNHVADIGTATQSLAATTAPGSLAVLTLDVHKYPFLQKLFKAIPGDILHPHQYTLKGYVALFNLYGFRLQGNLTLREGRLFDHELLVFKKM